MERLYRGFDLITNPVHTSNQQRQINYPILWDGHLARP
ncbi:hypothetical protein NSP_40600 [Nodularia spumigena CCY9414]|jgi:hypothetical protein|nr:hypothetical protein NSP_40600 [Nodularia spumigena CCY9414]